MHGLIRWIVCKIPEPASKKRDSPINEEIIQMDIIRFEHSEYFYLFFLLPVFLLAFLFARYVRKKALRSFGRQEIIVKLMPMVSVRRMWIKFSLLMVAVCMVILAAVNPMIGSRLEEARIEGVDIMIALDVSRSMLAEDIKPNRLERAKLSISRLIDRLEGDRIGVVLFTGQSITQVPLTSDLHAARMLLRTTSSESIQTQGTAIGSAIDRAVLSFAEDDLTNKVLIIISDGENHLDDPVESARIARERGLTIHTIGIGTAEGAPIPVYRNNQLTGFLRDNQGNTVVSRYDENILREIARLGGGVFQHGREADLGLGNILDEIRKLDTEEFDRLVFADYESRFHYFVAIALIILLIELFLFERKNKWLRKLKLFNP
jgi:Ca-activated chloride channel homolog